MLAEIFGPDILIVLVVIALLFGGSQLPKLARSLGSAKGEFEKGLQEGEVKGAAKAKGADKSKDDDKSKEDEKAKDDEKA